MASTKRRAWLEHYFTCWNATEAARLAGYKYPNKQGPALKAKLKAEIDARLDEMAMPANEVLARLGKIAQANIADFITETGAIDWQAVKENGQLVKRVVHQKGQRATIELHDALATLIHLDKVHGGKGGAAIPIPIQLTEVIVKMPDESLDSQ